MESGLLEKLIIKGCCIDTNYVATLSSVFLKDYFDNQTAAKIYEYQTKHFSEYKTLAPRAAIISEFDKEGITDTENFFRDIDSVEFDYARNYDFLFNSTNDYLKEKAVKKAILNSVDIINKKDDVIGIRRLVEDAISKDLRIDLGVNYFDTLAERFERVTQTIINRVPSGFPVLDEYISNGFPPYTLSVIVAKIHGFKCLSGNTEITINDNGLIQRLRIKDFFINTYNHEYKGDISMIKNNRMDMFVKKYGKIEGEKRYNQWVSKQKISHTGVTTNTLSDFTKRHGNNIGTIKYNEYINKLKKSNKNINSLEYYENKYGIAEGTILYNEKNKKISDPGRGTLEYFQNRYGIDEGILRYNQYIEKQKNSNSLNGYIKKYGEVDGNIKWVERCERSSRCRTLEGFVLKYGKTEGLIRWQQKQERWMNSYKKSNFSKISQKLFWLLYEKIKSQYNEIYFAELNEGCKDITSKNNEYILKTKKSYCRLDFFIKDINKCIEFDGDYWHGEKRGNQEKDIKRTKEIEKMGIQVLHVLERDYNKTPELVLENCLRFINE